MLVEGFVCAEEVVVLFVGFVCDEGFVTGFVCPEEFKEELFCGGVGFVWVGGDTCTGGVTCTGGDACTGAAAAPPEPPAAAAGNMADTSESARKALTSLLFMLSTPFWEPKWILHQCSWVPEGECAALAVIFPLPRFPAVEAGTLFYYSTYFPFEVTFRYQFSDKQARKPIEYRIKGQRGGMAFCRAGYGRSKAAEKDGFSIF